MRVHIGDNKLVIMIEPKTFHFDLPKDVDNNLKHETDFIMKQNECSTGHKTKKWDRQLLFKYMQWEQYSWTQKTVKLVDSTNLFLTCHRG